MKRANISRNTNSHRTFASAGLDVVEVGRDQKDVISTYHRHYHLIDVAGLKNGWTGPTPLAAQKTAWWRRGGRLKRWHGRGTWRRRLWLRLGSPWSYSAVWGDLWHACAGALSPFFFELSVLNLLNQKYKLSFVCILVFLVMRVFK